MQSQLGTYTGMTASSNNLVIGTRSWAVGVSELNGQLDEVKIWKGRELSQTEVTELYDLENAGTSVLP